MIQSHTKPLLGKLSVDIMRVAEVCSPVSAVVGLRRILSKVQWAVQPFCAVLLCGGSVRWVCAMPVQWVCALMVR